MKRALSCTTIVATWLAATCWGICLLHPGPAFAIDRTGIPRPPPTPTTVDIQIGDGGSLNVSMASVSIDGGQVTVLQGTSPWVVGGHSIQGNVTVDGGLIAVTNFPASYPVTGTFWQGTQPVSGTVTANAGSGTFAVSGSVTASGTVTSNQGISRDGGVDWPVSSKLVAADGTATGTASAPLRVDVTGSTTQPVSGTFWQATQPVSGTFWQATQPVSGTFWQATQPVSGSVTASGTVTSNQGLSRDGGTDWPVSAKLVDSTATALNTGNGTNGGSLRVSLASDSTGIVALTTGSSQIGHLEANQSVNLAQINAVTPVMAAASTAGAAADRALVVTQTPNGGNPCKNPTATVSAVAGATSGTAATQIIALSGSTKIYLCAVNITGVSGTTPTFSLVYGTGSNCATGQTTILGAWTTAANTVYAFIEPFVTPAGQAVCYKDTGTSPVQNYAITYVQQ